MTWKRAAAAVVVLAAVAIVAYWAVLPDGSPVWTGFGRYNEAAAGPRSKTLWDWMDLLIIPLVLALGAWWLNRSERASERELALDRQHEQRLEIYFDRMTELLLKEGLRTSAAEDEARSIARTRTMTTLWMLDPGRKGILLGFLHRAGLIRVGRAVVDLEWANLDEAYLFNAELAGSDLSRAKLYRAQMTGSDLRGACLHSAVAVSASLCDADLQRADLSNAILRLADLRNTDLTEADLSGTDLSWADLTGAKVTEAQLASAASLEKTRLPDGSLHS